MPRTVILAQSALRSLVGRRNCRNPRLRAETRALIHAWIAAAKAA